MNKFLYLVPPLDLSTFVFAYKYLNFPAPFIEKATCCLLNCLFTFVVNELTKCVQVYIWILFFFFFTPFSTLMPIPHGLDYCSLISLEFRQYKSPTFFPFSSCFNYSRFFEFPYGFRIAIFTYTHTPYLGFWFGMN